MQYLPVRKFPNLFYEFIILLNLNKSFHEEWFQVWTRSALENLLVGAVEMTQWLRGLAAVTEDWSSVPLPTADSSQPPVNPAQGGLIPSSSLYQLPNTHTQRYTYTHKQKQRNVLGVIHYINSLKKKNLYFY